MTSDRGALLERYGREYGELGLAIAFTDGLDGDNAKRVTRKGWNNTASLPDGPFGAALLANRGTQRNPVVVLGASALTGIDVDGPEGAQRLRRIAPERLPQTVTVETGKGWHLWYRRPFRAAGVAKIELSADGVTLSKDGYLVAPPALHPSGNVYAFVDGRAPWETEIAQLPEDLLDRFIAAAGRSRAAVTAANGGIGPGARHRYLLRLGCAMRRVGASEAAIVAALLEENAHRCEPPQEERLVRDLARDIAERYAPEAAT